MKRGDEGYVHPRDEYAAREREAMLEFAWKIANDPKASPELRAIAEERFVSGGTDKKCDWSRVPLDERKIALAALQKAGWARL